jgi:hypothetical protein
MSTVAIYSQPIDARNRLAELGLAEEILSTAIKRGQAEARSRTDNHPPMYRYLTPWGETTCALREGLLPKGWTRSDEGNLPFTVNPDGTLAIIVSTGDQNTGNKDASPCTKCTKGPRTIDAVESNERQASLFPIHLTPADIKKMQETGRRITWILMFHRDPNTQELRFELSRPINMNEEGQVAGWYERIIFGAIPFDDNVDRMSPDVPQTPIIDVDVKLRSA